MKPTRDLEAFGLILSTTSKNSCDVVATFTFFWPFHPSSENIHYSRMGMVLCSSVRNTMLRIFESSNRTSNGSDLISIMNDSR